MTIPDELLMAYADDELDPVERAQVDAEVHADSQLQQRVAAHRALRASLVEAYAPVLDEPVPERLLTTIREAQRPATGNVVKLHTVRSDHSGQKAAQPAAQPGRARAWRRWSLAAGIVVAIGIGVLTWRHEDAGMIQEQSGILVARGALADALLNQLSGDPSTTSGVTIGLSFMAKSGDYCRTFNLSAGPPRSGLACRHAARWQIPLLLPSDAGDPQSSGYRTAASPLPPALLGAVEREITGEPLARSAEIAARQAGWQPERR